MSTTVTAIPITEKESVALAIHAGIDSTQITQFEQEGLYLEQQANDLTVIDQESYDRMVELGKLSAGFLKRWKEFIQRPYDLIYGTYRRMLEMKNAVEGPGDRAKRRAGSEVVRWNSEQEQARLVEQRRREEEQRKQEEERRLNAAAEAEQAGASEETVEQIIEQQSTAPKPTVAPTYQKAAGTSVRANWSGEVVDFHALVKAAAKNKNLLSLLEVNQPALNAMARIHEATLSDVVPGTRGVNKGAASFRARS